MNDLITRQVLSDFFEGRATAVQKKLIEDWLEDEVNQTSFYRCLDEWERTHLQVAVKQEEAQNRYSAFLDGQASARKPVLEYAAIGKGAPAFWKPVLGIAAAVLTVCVLGFSFREQMMYKTYTSSRAHQVRIFLSDSTEVALNSNSSLKVPRFGFGKDVRQVWLDGEAEFKVRHKPDNLRFEVLMGDGYRIEVLGTEFNAFSRARGKRVFLSKGKVKLNLPKGKEVYLRPGNYFTADSQGRFKVDTPAEPLAITAWKEQTFYFDDARLTEVVAQINDRFGAKIRIADHELGARTIAGIYQAKDAEELLETLSTMFNMNITRHADEIELRLPQKQDL